MAIDYKLRLTAWLKHSLIRFLACNPIFTVRRFKDSRPYYFQPAIRAFWECFPNRREAKERVIIYGLRTYERYDLGVFEKVLSDALRYKRANVQNLICDGFLTSCDGSTYPESHEFLCASCKQQGKHFRKLYPNNFLCMADFLTEEDHANAKKTVNSIDISELKNYEFLGVKIGDHALASANKYFKNQILNYEDPRYIEVLRHNVFQGFLLVLIARGLLEKEKPTHFITLHGGYSTWGPISDYLGAHGVNIYIHNKSINRVGCFYITKAGQDLSDVIAKEVWEEQKHIALSDKQREQLRNHFMSVKEGKTTEYKLYDATKRSDIDPKLVKLLNSTGKKKFALYPHLFWDKAFLNRYDSLGSFFNDDIEWMFETIKFFINRKDSLLFVKPHPGENMAADFTEHGVAELIYDRFGSLPEHIIIVDKKCRLKSFDLMDSNCIGIVFTSTSGLEHNYFKKPVLTAGEIHYARAGAALRIISRQEYFDLLTDPQPLYDFIEKNYSIIERYAYYYYFRQQVKIPFYKDDVWLGHCIDWKLLSDYKNFIGADEAMNSITEAIIEGRHVMSLD